MPARDVQRKVEVTSKSDVIFLIYVTRFLDVILLGDSF